MNTRTIGVPKILHRAGTSEMSEDGKVKLSISTDTPYLRYDWRADEDYYEVLDHSPGSINMTRLRAGAALLFNHNRDIQLGTIDQPQVENGKLYVESKVSQAPDIESYRIRMEEKILKDTSVGYEVNEEGEYAGDKDGIPVYRFKWFPHEASMVTIPADINCGLGRDTADREERDGKKPDIKEIKIGGKIPLDATRRSENNSQERETRNNSMETPVAEPKAKSKAELDAEERERQEFLKSERTADRERQKEIRAIAKRGNNVPAEVIEKAIDDETTADNFRKLVFEKYFGNAQPLDTPSGDGNGDIKVIGERGKRSLGRQFVESDSFKRAMMKRGQGERIASVDVDFSVLGARGKVAMAQRAGFTSSDLAAVNVQIQTGVIGLGVQRLTVMDLIAPGSTGAAAIIYPRENSFGTVDGVAVTAGTMPRAKSVGERGVKPLWEPDLTTETANVRKIAITTKVPDEFMADFPAAQSFIDERLPFMVDTETEFQILYGDGLGNNLKGITTTGGIQTRAITTTDDSTIAMSLMKGLTDIRVNSFFEPDAYAFHPYDWETAKLLRDTNKNFLAGGPYYIPYQNGVFVELNTLWGKPVVVSTAVTYGKPLAGCWKLGAQYFLREGMRLEMTNANEDDFRRNLIMLRAEHRLALAVYRPISFLEFTGMPART